MRKRTSFLAAFSRRGGPPGDDGRASDTSPPVGVSVPRVQNGSDVAVADTWIDELQWLTGLPSNWGERRGRWFSGY
jgi:hypothetical protein